MSEEQLTELQEYNLEYLEAQQSEEVFGGDYTSAVELKYAKKEIERLHKIINDVKEYMITHRYPIFDNKCEKVVNWFRTANCEEEIIKILDKGV